MSARIKIRATSIGPVLLSVAPSLTITLRITCDDERIRRAHALLLRARLSINAAAHRFSARERDRLAPLFGDASQWSRTTRIPVPFADVSVATGGFEKETSVDLIVPCSYDLGIATTKLFEAFDDADGDDAAVGCSLPVTLLFSGTFFGEDTTGSLMVLPLSDLDTRVELPIRLWRELMAAHHPDGVLVALPRSVIDRLRDHAESSTTPIARTIERLVSPPR